MKREKRSFYREFLVIFLIIFLAFLFFLIKGSFSGYTITSLQNESGNVSQGNNIQVNITVTDVTNLSGIQIDVSYDPNVLSYESTLEGTFLNESGLVSTYFNESEINATSGFVRDIIIFRQGETNGATGNGTLAILNFFTSSPGISYVRLENVLFSNNTGGTINTTILNTSIVVSGDTTKPNLTIVSPTANQNLSTNNVTINISSADDTLLSVCNYNITNSTGGTVVATNTITCAVGSVEYQTISDGSNYILTAFANDTSNNINVTSRNFSVDTNPPNVTINSPSAGATFSSTNVTINITFAETLSFGSCTYNITNSTGGTVISNNDITCGTNSVEYQTITDGSDYVVTAFSNDSAGNSKIVSKTFSVDISGPNITINAPTASTLTTTNVTINLTFADSTALSVCNYNITNSTGGTVVATNTITCGTSSVEYQTVPEGNNYAIGIFANDTLGNSRVSNRTFSINLSAPNITINSPSSGQTFSTTNVTINISFSSVLGLSACSYNITNSTGGTVVATNTITCAVGSIEYQTISDGSNYVITSRVNDTLGASNIDSKTFIVDTTPEDSGSGGSGGGGGGGGGVAPSVTESQAGAESGANNTITFENFDSDIGIRKILIETNTPAENVGIIVSRYDGRPINVSVEKTGKVYRYLQIETENLGDNFKKATISFQVERVWLAENALQREDISMFRYNENSQTWGGLLTLFIEEDNKFYYYDTETGGFSYFAIAEKSTAIQRETWLILVASILVLLILITIIIIVVYLKKKRRESYGISYGQHPTMFGQQHY